MAYLLNVLYAVLLLVTSPLLAASAARKGKYRQGLGQKLLGLVPGRESDAECVWVHAVSMGEVSLIAPLIRQLRERHPQWDVVISTTTLTGYTLAKTRYSDLSVFYCPLDFSFAVRRAMRRIRPSLLVLAELELWPNLIAAAREHGAKVAIINGRLSDRSFRGYRRFRKLVAPLVAQVDVVAAQNEQYAERFREIGAPAERVHVTGSLKFDGAQTDRENAATLRLRELAGFAADDVVFLAGSTQQPEEQLALEAFRQLSPRFPHLRLVLVPRHPDRFAEVAQMLTAEGVFWQKRSQLDRLPADPRARVLLVDRVGELGAWWGTAAIAYVGGSMGPRQGQNMIEPAAYGAAVSFGPKTRNFRDVVAVLLADEAAIVVQDGRELTEFVRHALTDPDWAGKLGQRAQRVVASQLGATRRTVELLEQALGCTSHLAMPSRTAA